MSCPSHSFLHSIFIHSLISFMQHLLDAYNQGLHSYQKCWLNSNYYNSFHKDISRYHTRTLLIFPKEVPFSKISLVHFGRSCCLWWNVLPPSSILEDSVQVSLLPWILTPREHVSHAYLFCAYLHFNKSMLIVSFWIASLFIFPF